MSWVTPGVLTGAEAYADICPLASINEILSNKLQTGGKWTQRLKSLPEAVMYLQDILTELYLSFTLYRIEISDVYH